jgi:hypothetical protein
MFELLLHTLKRVPHPPVPFLPIVGAVLGPIATLLLIVYCVPAVPGEAVSGWHWQARSHHGAVGPVSASASRTRTTNSPL